MMELFQSPSPELTERQKTSISLMDLAFNATRLKDVLEGLQRLLDAELLTPIECQHKADVAINQFMEYCNKGGEGY